MNQAQDFSLCHIVLGMFHFLNKKASLKIYDMLKISERGFSLSSVFPLLLYKIKRKEITLGISILQKNLSLWISQPFETLVVEDSEEKYRLWREIRVIGWDVCTQVSRTGQSVESLVLRCVI